MNKFISLALLATVFVMTGCSMFDTKKGIAVTPTLATAIENEGSSIFAVPEDVVKVAGGWEARTSEDRDLTPAVPRIKQAQVIGVVRELVKSGCVIEKVATTDGIHYSQLIIGCREPQAAPAIQ